MALAPSTDPARAATSASAPRAPGPAPVPAAYFGELARERVTDPLVAQPLENGSVLLIVLESTNARHVGAYGYARATSPQIDALAADGLLLTDYYSTSSWTRPSFTSIITGLPKREHKMELDCPPLDDGLETLAERLREAGFATAGFVGNPLVQARWGFGQGFDTYVDAAALDDYSLADDGELARRAASWLEQQRGRRFFALVFFTAPHAPYDPPPGYRRFFDGLPPGHVIARPRREYRGGMPSGDLARTAAAYDGEVLFADAQIGKLVAALRASGQLERTHVIVTADHGEVFGEHGCFQHGYHMWDPALRVPFVLSSPSMPGGGLYDDRSFSHLDVAPTLLDLAGIDPDPALPGQSIVAALADPWSNRERVIYSQYNAHGVRRQAIRKGRYKLVHHHPVDRTAAARLNTFEPGRDALHPDDLPTVAWGAERYELFDMLADPRELTDLYAARSTAPETIELIGELTERVSGDDEVSIDLDGKLLRSLKKLGYLAPGE